MTSEELENAENVFELEGRNIYSDMFKDLNLTKVEVTLH